MLSLIRTMTVGSGISPVSACHPDMGPLAGYNRRWGISPRPENRIYLADSDRLGKRYAGSHVARNQTREVLEVGIAIGLNRRVVRVKHAKLAQDRGHRAF